MLNFAAISIYNIFSHLCIVGEEKERIHPETVTG